VPECARQAPAPEPGNLHAYDRPDNQFTSHAESALWRLIVGVVVAFIVYALFVCRPAVGERPRTFAQECVATALFGEGIGTMIGRADRIEQFVKLAHPPGEFAAGLLADIDS
jgi:hypothetical protein